MFFDLPTRWEERDFGGGNYGLFGLTIGTMHVVAPPGVTYRADESAQHAAVWRHAIWNVEDDFCPVVAFDPPEISRELSTSAVVEMLPPVEHEFVRSVLARQLRLSSLYAAADENGRKDDKHAQRAGRARSWAADELRAAFPGEHWYREAEVKVEIPATIEELLMLMPRPSIKAVGDGCEGATLVPPLRLHGHQKLGLRFFCRYVLEDFRYSLLLRLMSSRESGLKPELRERQKHLRDSPGEVLGTSL